MIIIIIIIMVVIKQYLANYSTIIITIAVEILNSIEVMELMIVMEEFNYKCFLFDFALIIEIIIAKLTNLLSENYKNSYFSYIITTIKSYFYLYFNEHHSNFLEFYYNKLNFIILLNL